MLRWTSYDRVIGWKATGAGRDGVEQWLSFSREHHVACFFSTSRLCGPTTDALHLVVWKSCTLCAVQYPITELFPLIKSQSFPISCALLTHPKKCNFPSGGHRHFHTVVFPTLWKKQRCWAAQSRTPSVSPHRKDLEVMQHLVFSATFEGHSEKVRQIQMWVWSPSHTNSIILDNSFKFCGPCSCLLFRGNGFCLTSLFMYRL